MESNKNKMNEIAEMLETGVKAVFENGEYQRMLDTMSKFYKYSANNCFLILAQMPDATHVAGYRAWADKFGRQVKKGEKAIRIIAPCPHKKQTERVNEDGEVEAKEIQWVSYRAVPVFDISQTEGEDLPEIAHDLTGGVDGYEELLERVKGISPVAVKFEEVRGGAHGFYSHLTNSITVKEGMSEQQTVKTLVHEIAHAILHNEEGEQKDADSNTREVQAESVAYIVCKHIGIDTSDYSFGYVAGWSGGKETKELTASMEVIRKTAAGIIESLAA